MGGVTWEVVYKVYKQKNTKTYGACWFCVHWSEEKIQKHTKHMTCSSIFFMLKKNTKTRKIKKGVSLCICPFVAEEKYKNTQNTKRVPCAVWASPHAYNKTQKIKKINPTKQVLSIVFLHIYNRVLKSTKIHNGWQFFSRIRDKKTQNYIKHKRHIWSFSDP